MSNTLFITYHLPIDFEQQLITNEANVTAEDPDNHQVMMSVKISTVPCDRQKTHWFR